MRPPRTRRSGVLVVRGEPGIGKSVLLDVAAARADGFSVMRVSGVESEVELPYAALQQLCRPFIDRVPALPAPQRAALLTAFGLGSGSPPNRFLVGLAALQLLAGLAEEQPVLAIVDDAQWLDRVSVQTIEFVARRLLAEQIVLLIAERDAPDRGDFRRTAGAAAARTRRCRRGRSARLGHGGPYRSKSAGAHSRRESRKSACALGAAAHVDVGGARGGTCGRATGPIGRESGRRFREAAAVVACGYPTVVDLGLPPSRSETRRCCGAAAEHLGLGWDAASTAEAAGLIEFGTKVRFRHPLVRAAAYRDASTRERLDVHHTLGQITDPIVDPDRRAWHRANATVTQDDEIALELERSAERGRRHEADCSPRRLCSSAPRC